MALGHTRSLPQCLVRLALHGEHKSDRVMNEPGGMCACLSAPCHSLVNPLQRASVHASVVPPFSRNVMGEAQDEAQSPCHHLSDLEGPLPCADDLGMPLHPDPRLLSPWRVGQDRATCPVSSLRDKCPRARADQLSTGLPSGDSTHVTLQSSCSGDRDLDWIPRSQSRGSPVWGQRLGYSQGLPETLGDFRRKEIHGTWPQGSSE